MDEKVKQDDLKKIEELIQTVKYGTVTNRHSRWKDHTA